MYLEPRLRDVVRAFGQGLGTHRGCILEQPRCEVDVRDEEKERAHTINILFDDDCERTKKRVFEGLQCWWRTSYNKSEGSGLEGFTNKN